MAAENLIDISFYIAHSHFTTTVHSLIKLICLFMNSPIYRKISSSSIQLPIVSIPAHTVNDKLAFSQLSFTFGTEICIGFSTALDLALTCANLCVCLCVSHMFAGRLNSLQRSMPVMHDCVCVNVFWTNDFWTASSALQHWPLGRFFFVFCCCWCLLCFRDEWDERWKMMKRKWIVCEINGWTSARTVIERIIFFHVPNSDAEWGLRRACFGEDREAGKNWRLLTLQLFVLVLRTCELERLCVW